MPLRRQCQRCTVRQSCEARKGSPPRAGEARATPPSLAPGASGPGAPLRPLRAAPPLSLRLVEAAHQAHTLARQLELAHLLWVVEQDHLPPPPVGKALLGATGPEWKLLPLASGAADQPVLQPGDPSLEPLLPRGYCWSPEEEVRPRPEELGEAGDCLDGRRRPEGTVPAPSGRCHRPLEDCPILAGLPGTGRG